MKKLNFLVAGVQKGGTTALHTFLRQHPAIYAPTLKELHFFDDETVDWKRPDYDTLHGHFRSAASDRLWGEFTPIYSYWRPAMERIAAYNPGIRLIIILRDPVERAYSHWCMERSRGAEHLPFSKAVREGRRRFRPGDLSTAERVFSYVERGFYAEQIRRMLKLFPGQHLLFLDNADLRMRHRETMDRICSFLGIGSFPVTPVAEEVLPVVKTAQLPMGQDDRKYLLDLFRADTVETGGILEQL